MLIWGLYFVSLTLSVVCLFIAIYNLVYLKYTEQLKVGKPEKPDLCIPVRNESKNLQKLLPILSKNQKEFNQIIFLDDYSDDDSFIKIKRHSAVIKNLLLLKGKKPPSGWTGKNWACHQLAKSVKSSYFLLIDADVHLKKGVALKLTNYSIEQKLSLLSVFPKQNISRPKLYSIIPILDHILLSLCPIKLIKTLKLPVLSAANGQCMLFKTKSYHENQWHKAIRDKVDEDIQIARLMKRLGYKIDILKSKSEVNCQMYGSLEEAYLGFSKNLNSMLIGTGFSWCYIFFQLLIIPFFFTADLPFMHITVLILLQFSTRGITAFLAKQSSILNILFYPIQLMNMVILVCLQKFFELKGNLQWKGRNIYEVRT